MMAIAELAADLCCILIYLHGCAQNMTQMIHIHILFSFAYVSMVCCTNIISTVTIDHTKLRNCTCSRKCFT